jgi:hypothetical protein
MNDEIRALMAEGTGMAEEMLGEAFTINGTSYRGVFATGQPNVQMLQHGVVETTGVTMRATIEQFATPPKKGEAVAWNGSSLRVQSVYADSLHYVFELMNRG